MFQNGHKYALNERKTEILLSHWHDDDFNIRKSLIQLYRNIRTLEMVIIKGCHLVGLVVFSVQRRGGYYR
jgi:hypothetical protein